MTLEQIKDLSRALTHAMKEYQKQGDYNECELECVVDDVLCKLPRDIVYVEWLTRSDIQNMADGVYDEPAEPEMLDDCMQNLWDNDSSLLDTDIAEAIVVDTIRNKGV